MESLTRTDYLTCLAEIAALGIAITVAVFVAKIVPTDILQLEALAFFGVFVASAKVALPFANRGYDPDADNE